MSRMDRQRKDQDRALQARREQDRTVSSTDLSGSDAHGRAEQMSLAELTGAADVSVRTVRYYIAEGLLPPPEGSGPSSAYSPGHLARLRLIQRLKESYLPLKEIRRRLSGLGDDEVLAILAHDEESPSADAYPPPPDASLAGARDYLSLLESRAQYRTEPLALSLPVAPPASASASSPSPPPRQEQGALAPLAAPGMSPDMAEGIANRQRLAGPEREKHAGRQEQGLWRRIPLGDEAELVISDRVYGRHQDRVDWLVRWARKVFD